MEQPTSEFIMPGSSWDSIKRIVKAYYAAHGDKETTVQKIASLGGISRPVISKNNNFLRSIGIVETSDYALTPVGVRLAVGMQKNDRSLVTEALHEIINKSEKLKRMAKVVQARGTMSEEAFRTEAMLVLDLNERSVGFGYLRTLLELLYESHMLTLKDGKVSFHGDYIGTIKAVAEEDQGDKNAKSDPPRREDQSQKVPIALGPERRAYLELPNDWQAKDLAKLLKMIELALGDDVNH